MWVEGRAQASCLAALLVMSAGCEAPPQLTATVDVSATQKAMVGGRAQLVVVVANTGPAISRLGLVFRSPDKWYEQHDVTDLGGCTLEREQSGFSCADLAAGATATITITGTAIQAGTFHYELALRELTRPFHYINDHPDGAEVHVWDETVQ